MASEAGHADVLRELCGAGADVHRAAIHGATALHLAAEGGHLEAVRILCDAGAGTNEEAAHGATPLMMAALEGRADVVRALCAAGAEKNKASANGVTPLITASLKGHLEVVCALCAAGADRQQAAANGMTPSQVASSNGHAMVVRALCNDPAGTDRSASNVAQLHVSPYQGVPRATSTLCGAVAHWHAAAALGAQPKVGWLCNEQVMMVLSFHFGRADPDAAPTPRRDASRGGPLSQSCWNAHTLQCRLRSFAGRMVLVRPCASGSGAWLRECGNKRSKHVRLGSGCRKGLALGGPAPRRSLQALLEQLLDARDVVLFHSGAGCRGTAAEVLLRGGP